MQVKYLHKDSHEKCILFMGGWSCDSYPFMHLKSDEYDVVMCYDYRNILLPKELNRLFENYEEVILIAWSLGVYVANLMFADKESLFIKTVALNGTLLPIDNLKGIAPSVFQGTIDGLNRRNLEKFWMRMCGGKLAYEDFIKHSPKRELQDQLEELKALQSVIQTHHIGKNIYQQVVIGTQDLIFLPENQRRAWINHQRIQEWDLPHFCFNKWNSWDEIIGDLSSDESTT